MTSHFEPTGFRIELHSQAGEICAVECVDFRSAAGRLLRAAELSPSFSRLVEIYAADARAISEFQKVLSPICLLLMDRVQKRGPQGITADEMFCEMLQLGTRDELHVMIVGVKQATATPAQPESAFDLDDLDEFWATGRLGFAAEDFR